MHNNKSMDATIDFIYFVYYNCFLFVWIAGGRSRLRLLHPHLDRFVLSENALIGSHPDHHSGRLQSSYSAAAAALRPLNPAAQRFRVSFLLERPVDEIRFSRSVLLRGDDLQRMVRL